VAELLSNFSSEKNGQVAQPGVLQRLAPSTFLLCLLFKNLYLKSIDEVKGRHFFYMNWIFSQASGKLGKVWD
jgi:hypothetical protein